MPAGPLTKLQRSFAYRVSPLFPSGMLRWIDAVSGFIDNFTGGGTQLQERWVNEGGNDTTGDGSFDNPFLTVAAAMASITDATVTKPYTVWVAPGIYATAFTLKPNVYIVGAGSGAGNPFGAPLTGATVLAPTAAQVLDASWAGATVNSGGITGCCFSTVLKADFAAIGSLANSSIKLQDILTESAITIIGNSNYESVTMHNVYVNATVDITLTNVGESILTNIVSDFVGAVRINQSGAFQGFHFLSGLAIYTLALTWTSALIANNMIVIAPELGCVNGTAKTGIGVSTSGAGVSLNAPLAWNVAMSDAANRLSFGNVAAATMVGINGGTNVVTCTPTANRVLTIDPQAQSTRPTTIIVRNRAAVGSGFNIDLTLNTLTLASGSPTYVPPGGEVLIRENFIDSTWTVQPYVQAGSVALTNGVSANIPADINAASRIVMSLKTVSGAFGTPVTTTRTNGTRVGGGLFVITSTLPATGATVTTDQGTYDWFIMNGGG
jgi:hypothetical protein